MKLTAKDQMYFNKRVRGNIPESALRRLAKQV